MRTQQSMFPAQNSQDHPRCRFLLQPTPRHLLLVGRSSEVRRLAVCAPRQRLICTRSPSRPRPSTAAAPSFEAREDVEEEDSVQSLEDLVGLLKQQISDSDWIARNPPAPGAPSLFVDPIAALGAAVAAAPAGAPAPASAAPAGSAAAALPAAGVPTSS